MPASARGHWTAVLQALLVTFLWSTSWVLIRWGLEEMPPLLFAGLRYTLAFLLMAPWLVASRRLRRALAGLGRKEWLRLVALGVVYYSLTQGALFVALGHLPAVTLSLTLSFSPAAIALLAIPLLGERPTGLQWLGIAIFLAGTAVYFLPVQVPLSGIGVAAALVCLLANSVASIQGREVNRAGDLSPVLVTVVSMGAGSLLLLAGGVALAGGLPPIGLRSWLLILWLAAVNTALAFTLWNHTLRRLTAVESSLVNNTMMVQIAILAWLFLGETLTGREVAGLALALAGVVLVQLPRGKRSEAAPAEPGGVGEVPADVAD